MYQKSKVKTMLDYDENGDIDDVTEVQEIIKVVKRHFKKGEFYMSTFSLDNLILEEKYNLPEIKTLIALKRRLDFNNRIQTFRQSDIAKEINSSQARVSKAMKRLQNDNIIYKNDLDWYFSDEFIKFSGEAPRKTKAK